MTTKKKIAMTILALYSLGFMMLVIGKSSYQTLIFTALYIFAVLTLTWAFLSIKSIL